MFRINDSKVKKIVVLMLVITAAIPSVNILAQETPSYSFISFDESYNRLLRDARSKEYEVKEEEINSAYGTYLIFINKKGRFYSESISLFFNEKKELIFYSIGYGLNENHSRTIIEKLIRSMSDKLSEKYGSNERESAPYYKVHENNYEIFLHPTGSAPTAARVSFKQIDRFAEYQEYHKEEVEKLENEEIEKTVGNL